MALTFHTNMSSLLAQYQLRKTMGELETAQQRMSNGLRVASAKDDPAGLAIATRFGTQISGLMQAQKNASDGVSMASTGDGALKEMTEALQRIRNLALQSANGTNSDTDRDSLDKEVANVLAEVTRMASQTNFNGVKLLDGSRTELSFQVGANVGETVQFKLGKGVRPDQLGSLASGKADVSAAFAFTPYADTQAVKTDWSTVNGQSLGKVSYDGVEVDWSAYKGKTLADAKNFLAGSLGRDFEVSLNGMDLDIKRLVGDPLVLKKGDLTLELGNGERIAVTGAFRDIDALVAALNANPANGMTAFVGDDGGLSFTSRSDISVSGAQATALGFLPSYAVDNRATLASGSVLTRDAAYDLIARIDVSLGAISAHRATLGAMENRFTSAIRNIETMSQTFKSAQGTILNADEAEETAKASALTILAQANVAILAQANQTPQMILKLLQ